MHDVYWPSGRSRVLAFALLLLWLCLPFFLIQSHSTYIWIPLAQILASSLLQVKHCMPTELLAMLARPSLPLCARPTFVRNGIATDLAFCNFFCTILCMGSLASLNLYSMLYVQPQSTLYHMMVRIINATQYEPWSLLWMLMWDVFSCTYHC